MHFTRQLAVFVKAGIPITEALTTIGDETEDVALRRALSRWSTTSATAVCSRRPPRSTPRCSPTTTSASCNRPSSPAASTRRWRACGLPRTRDRDPRQGRVGAVVPRRRHGDGDLHRRSSSPATCCRSSSRCSRNSTPTCRCRPGCCCSSPLLHRSVVHHGRVLRRVHRGGVMFLFKHPTRQGAEGPTGAQDPCHQGHRRLRDPRAVLPHPRRR